MKIRNKITIGIAGTALLAALSLASFIFLEMMEEPLKLIDRELDFVAESLFEQGAESSSGPWQIDTTLLPYSPDGYWIKVYNPHGQEVYGSLLTRFTEIPAGTGRHSRYNVERVIPRTEIDIGQDDFDEVVFRVRVLERNINGHHVTMRIAKPIEELEEQLIEVMLEALLGVVICVTVIIAVSYYLAGRILRPVVTMTDLARKISEDSLDQRIPLGKNKDELAALAASLNKMFDGLQYSFDRQRAFISNGSHELKSPLTRLLLTQEELLQNQELPEEIRADLDRQHDTMRRMKRLIHNLLNLSRLEQQDTLTLETFNMGLLLREVVDNYQEMFVATKIEFVMDLPEVLTLEGDRMKLYQVFVNLMDNGIRYNDPLQGRVTMTCRQENRQCIVEIDNGGLEIPQEEHELIFEQFYRVEKSRASIHGGVGLGLTISRKIVELHGGVIEIGCSQLGGTMLRVILPCHR